MHLTGRIWINTFLNRFTDISFMDQYIDDKVMPNTMRGITSMTKADMVLRKNSPPLNVKSGFLYKNIGWNTSQSPRRYVYIGNLTVNMVVPYSRIHELGGTIHMSKAITPRMREMNFRLRGVRKKLRRWKIVLPPRKYLFQPAVKYAVYIMGLEISEMLSAFARGASWVSLGK